MKLLGIVFWAAIALVACAPTIASPNPTTRPAEPTQLAGRPVLGARNGSTLSVTVTVNGAVVGTVQPSAVMPPLDFANLPPFPWTVEARSPSDRVLTSMTVDSGYVTLGTDPNGNLGSSFTFGRVDLSCGRVTIWAGYSELFGPAPAPSAGSPGDCVP